QSLAGLTARLLEGLDRALEAEQPDLVLAQGDTTTVLASALASFYRRVPFGHVEAGLRTHQLDLPFPEEANRVLAGHLAALHFAPTPAARANLLREGLPDAAIHVTGNTGIDALFLALERREPLDLPLEPGQRLLLVTAHRRDSFGEPIRHICRAIRELSQRYRDVQILWPVHPNPSIQAVVKSYLAGLPRIHLCEPLPYGRFVSALQAAHLILTDSGGIQEEAPALGKPVLVLRDRSERPEAIHAGVACLVGTSAERILAQAGLLLEDPKAYARMSVGASPYGDGAASGRIVKAAQFYLQSRAASSRQEANHPGRKAA
ncbi:MAG: UDP-N-acetylglucosamine 2-epimerase (non-hydrolyzing), partial [Planctomycetes bacterium]|nr:UDP-N-acetylglucosamine 2-epimerase (non-hydrolyzing) [Planctomycetota bacterium]